MTPRHVVLVAPPWYPVPPHGYGGIEIVVSLLDRELRRRGHRVTVLAAAGSEGAVICASQGWHADLGTSHQGVREATYASRVIRALEQIGRVDIIHDHAGAATLVALSLGARAPLVHTVHGPVPEADRAFYTELGDEVGIVAISDSQRRSAPHLNWMGRVFNAVDVDALEVCDPREKEPYLLCLARICEEKGQSLAIEVARRVGMKLILAGKVEATSAGMDYFEGEVEPFIDGHRVVHLSNVGGVEKTRLLSRATALLAPLQWDEPFGLAVAEAMASGTPAICTRRGASPELVEEGVTGFLADDIDSMVAAVHNVADLDPLECACAARARFTPGAMVDGYLSVYDRVTARTATAVA